MGWQPTSLLREQGIQHVLTLVKYLLTPRPFNSLLQISLQWYQGISTGVSFSPDKISILGQLESDETTMHGPRFSYMDKTVNQEKRE